MPELMTTDEAAAYLRVSERKLYELVAAGAVPCSKVTGRWLFPKASLDRWVVSGMAKGLETLQQSPPPIVGGSYDPLLEWALRESGSGLASLPEGSETGLRRLVRRDVMAAAIHIHPLEGSHERANIEAVARTPGLHDAVLIAFARREQGFVVAAGNPDKIGGIGGIGSIGSLRLARRQDGAGAQLLLLSLLAQANIAFDSLTRIRPDCATGAEIAQAIRAGRADCGISTRSVAHSAGLGFVPLVWELFDLVLRQRDYFLPGPQRLFGFVRSGAFRQRAAELGGYNTAETGDVRLVN